MYVDIEDRELADYPLLADAVAERMRLPMVLIDGQVKHPSGISLGWIEAQLASLGLEPFASQEFQTAAEEGR